jgi:predicted amidohydrolase YtcJ
MGIDRLFVNANVVPMTGPLVRYQTLAIEGQSVVFVGDEAPEGIASASAETIDVRGRTILPGFIDTNVHASSLGLVSLGADLRGADSPAALARRLGQWIDEHPQARAVLGASVPTGVLDGADPSPRELLDRIEPERPTLVLTAPALEGAANTALLRAAGLLAGGGRSPLVGLVDGRVVGRHARRAIDTLLARLGRRALVHGLFRAANQAVAAGVTTLHTLEGRGFPDSRDIERICRARHVLRMNLVPYFEVDDPKEAQRLCGREVGGASAVVAPADAEAFPAVGLRRSARSLLGRPYGRKLVLREQVAVDRWVLAAHRQRLQISLIAAGPEAIEMAIRALEAAHARVPRIDTRHRIERCLLPTWEQIQRIADVGACVSVAPGLLWPVDGQVVASGRQSPPPPLPLRWMVDSGVLVGGSSEAPHTALDPLLGVSAACNHPFEEQRLDVYEAIALFTCNAARLAFEETDKGSLAIGRRADLVILGADPFEAPLEELRRLHVEATWLAGRSYEPQHMGAGRFAFAAFAGRLREAARI